MNKIKKNIWYIETIFKLGIIDVFYIFYYRFTIKFGFRKKLFKTHVLSYSQDFFLKEPSFYNEFLFSSKTELLEEANQLLMGNMRYYSHHVFQIGNCPNWFLNPFNGEEFKNSAKHWTELSDFNNSIGDIKNLWEPSRFSWLTVLARAYIVSGNEVYLETLNNWVNDWVTKNPINIGPNWKCGQETSFRLFNLLMSSVILGSDNKPSDSFKTLIKYHLERIELNINYAIAQRNNHSTSEAAALYIGYNWLEQNSNSESKLFKTKAKKALNQLKKIVNQLVYTDGSFSQHSITYHRVFIDTISYVYFWNKRMNLEELDLSFNNKIKKAIEWLNTMMDETSYDCPNLGANDGAHILSFHQCSYRDFRPCLQTINYLVNNKLLFENGSWNEPLFWLGYNDFSVVSKFEKKSKVHECGYTIINAEESWALIRFPYYKFRPAHNDVLHFDLWNKGINILMDAGSYSYNVGKDYKGKDLKSVKAHNTISFDNGEQMPRLSRFLLAKWIKADFVGKIKEEGNHYKSWKASYFDYRHNFHERKVVMDGKSWEIIDEFKGPSKMVELGFNINSELFELDISKKHLKLSWGNIELPNQGQFEIQKSNVSKFYWQKEEINRLVISTTNNNSTKIKINIY